MAQRDVLIHYVMPTQQCTGNTGGNAESFTDRQLTGGLSELWENAGYQILF
jgi:hypothetical protein